MLRHGVDYFLITIMDKRVGTLMDMIFNFDVIYVIKFGIQKARRKGLPSLKSILERRGEGVVLIGRL